MVSTSCLLLMLSIFQCGIVISKGSTLATSNSSIPVSKLVEEMRRGPLSFQILHLTYILAVESYGDHVYDLSQNLSEECMTAIKATSLVYQKLALGSSMSEGVLELSSASVRDMENTTQLEEHPLVFWCRRLAQAPPEKQLVRAIEKAKIEAANYSLVSSRPPYHSEVHKLDSDSSLYFDIVDKFIIPEFARLAAMESFFLASDMRGTNCSNSLPGFSQLRFIFAKSCIALAKQEKLADKMQSIFAKVMNETIPDIAVADRHERIKDCSLKCGCWWISKMMKAMYNYIVSDPTLEVELNKTAYFIGNINNVRKIGIQFDKL